MDFEHECSTSRRFTNRYRTPSEPAGMGGYAGHRLARDRGEPGYLRSCIPRPTYLSICLHRT